MAQGKKIQQKYYFGLLGSRQLKKLKLRIFPELPPKGHSLKLSLCLFLEARLLYK